MCSGPMFQYQICNSEECPGPYEDFRAQQCAKRNSYYVHENAKHSWIPYEPDGGEWGPVPSTSRPVALGICWVLIFPGRACYAWPTNRDGGTVAAPKGALQLPGLPHAFVQTFALYTLWARHRHENHPGFEFLCCFLADARAMS